MIQCLQAEQWKNKDASRKPKKRKAPPMNQTQEAGRFSTVISGYDFLEGPVPAGLDGGNAGNISVNLFLQRPGFLV